MAAAAVAAALLSAFVHAVWNALLKAGSDRLLDSFWVAVGWLALGAALVLWMGPPPVEAWPFLMASGAVHAVYWAALLKGYEFGELSHVYTLSRGLAPSVVLLGGFVFAGESPSELALSGVALVCAGVLAVGASPNAPLKASLWALLIATLIGSYTLLDALGARLSNGAARYLGWSLILSAAPLLIYPLWTRGGAALTATMRGGAWRRGLMAGAVSGGGYGLVLFAQTQGAVGQVTALRETSVVFAALLAAAFLSERLSLRRWIGVGLVAGGALCAALG